jgi:hypothetical protein
MRKVLLILLLTVLVLGLSAATGYAGYRFGYAEGVQAMANGDDLHSRLRPFDEFGPRSMPNFGFGRGGPRGFGPGSLPLLGFGFFPFVRWLMPITVLAVILAFIYWVFTRGGWRLIRQTTESVAPRTENE